MHAKLLKSMLLCLAVSVAAPAEGRDLRAVARTMKVPSSAYAYRLAAVGDSMSNDSSDYPGPLRTSLLTEWGANSRVNVYATAGHTTTQMLATNYPAALSFHPHAMSILGGINDIIQGATAEQIEANLQQMYDAQLARGGEVVAITILPFGASTSYTADREVVRDAVNAWILSYCASHVRTTCVDASTDMDDGAGNLKAEYAHTDNLHPNATGSQRIAALVVASGCWSNTTNLLLRSDAMSVSPWLASGTPTVTANTWDYGYGVTGITVEDTHGSSTQSWVQPVNTTTEGAYTASCHFQAGTLSTARLTFVVTGGTGGLTCNISGLSGTTSRASCSTTVGAGVTKVSVYVAPGSAAADTGSIKVGGCQLETGAVVTRYKPTTSAAYTAPANSCF